MSASDTLGVHVVPFAGKELRFAPITLEIECLAKQRLQKRALDDILALQPSYPAPVFAQLLAGWRQDCAGGLYSWGSVAMQAWSFSREGTAYLMYLQLKKNSPEWTEEAVDALLREEGADEQLIGGWAERFFPKVWSACQAMTRTPSTSAPSSLGSPSASPGTKSSS